MLARLAQHRAPHIVLGSWDRHPFFAMKLEPGQWELSEGLWPGLTIVPLPWPQQETLAQGSSALLQGCPGPAGPWEGRVWPGLPGRL